MKHLKLAMAMYALCAGMHAQPLTGLDTYQHTASSLLSNAEATSINTQGFLMAGYMPVSTNGTNFYIDKTDVDGNFNAAPGEFMRNYLFAADATSACGASVMNSVRCYGLAAMEIAPATNGAWYILASTYDKGILFASLDQNGAALSSAYYTFPQSAFAITKPVIARSRRNPGRYFIGGSYTWAGNTQMYMLCVTINGGVIWSNTYTLNNATTFAPSAILESRVVANQLAVVGTVNVSNNNNLDDGFYATLATTNGAFIQMQTYDSGNSTNERFNSIEYASFATQGGYIIGGYSDDAPAAGTSWMLRIGLTGAINWSSKILPSVGNAGNVVQAKERFSTVYGQMEYYGASQCGNGMTVFKLDNAGNLFSQPGNLDNEFNYNENTATGVPAAFSFIDVGLPHEGIHVYGTANFAGLTGDHFLARACFNGAAGNGLCTSPANINLVALPASYATSGPTLMVPKTVTTTPGPVPCPAYIFTSTTLPVTVTAMCDLNGLPSTPYVGNQNRTAATTGIEALHGEERLMLSPNPVSDKLTITYKTLAETNATISLSNSLGQLLMAPLPINASQAGATTELDLSTLDLKSGVYFVTISAEGVNTTKKIIYRR